MAEDLLLEKGRPDLTLLGDAIELGALEQEHLTVRVSVAPAYSEAEDEFRGRVPALGRDTIARWTEGYRQGVADFIRAGLALEKGEATQACKVGLVSFNPEAIAASLPEGALKVRPVNHLVTVAFNRRLAMERFEDASYSSDGVGSSVAHELWASAFRYLLDSMHSFTMSCPSQLFLELALITSDGFVPITQKSSTTAVYSRRNGGNMVWTCGVERGIDWKDAFGNRPVGRSYTEKMDLGTTLSKALAEEYQLEASSLADAGGPGVSVYLKSVAVQMLHLNTALVGYCTLPLPKAAFAPLKGKKSGGLDHSELHFVSLAECENLANTHATSTAWHGTAVPRLRYLAEDRERIRERLELRDRTGQYGDG